MKSSPFFFSSRERKLTAPTGMAATVTLEPATEPSGSSPYAEALRELIADIDERRLSRQRPALRLVYCARSH